MALRKDETIFSFDRQFSVLLELVSKFEEFMHGHFSKKTRPSSDTEAATMYKLKGQSSNMRTGQGFM